MKKIILGLAIVLTLSFCVADIVSANVFIQERYRMHEASKGCRDTDGGRDAYTKGTTCMGSSCKTDVCVSEQEGFDSSILDRTRLSDEERQMYGSMLKEYYCGWGKVGYGYPQTETAEVILKTHTICPNGCKDGACVRKGITYAEPEAGTGVGVGTGTGTGVDPTANVQPIITLIREAINKLNNAIRLLYALSGQQLTTESGGGGSGSYSY